MSCIVFGLSPITDNCFPTHEESSTRNCNLCQKPIFCEKMCFAAKMNCRAAKKLSSTSNEDYLEAKNAADEEQNDEDQAHVAESSDLLFVGEVIRLQREAQSYSSSTQTAKASLWTGEDYHLTSCCR